MLLPWEWANFWEGGWVFHDEISCVPVPLCLCSDFSLVILLCSEDIDSRVLVQWHPKLLCGAQGDTLTPNIHISEFQGHPCTSFRCSGRGVKRRCPCRPSAAMACFLCLQSAPGPMDLVLRVGAPPICGFPRTKEGMGLSLPSGLVESGSWRPPRLCACCLCQETDSRWVSHAPPAAARRTKHHRPAPGRHREPVSCRGTTGRDTSHDSAAVKISDAVVTSQILGAKSKLQVLEILRILFENLKSIAWGRALGRTSEGYGRPSDVRVNVVYCTRLLLIQCRQACENPTPRTGKGWCLSCYWNIGILYYF